MSAFRACAVVPTYDNPKTVRQVVEQIGAHVETVIVVDDGSAAPAQAILEMLRSLPDVVVLRHAQNQGKGAAMKTGLTEADTRGFSHALQVDADGQHDLQDIPRMLDAARQRPEALVLGTPRFDETRPAFRGFGHWLTSFWTRIEVGGPAIDDPQCGFRVYPVKAAVAANVRGNRMDYDPEVAVKMVWGGSPVINFPTRVRYLQPQDGGVSHFHMGWDNLLISWMHTRLVVMAIGRFLLGRGRANRPSRSSPSWLSIPERGSVLGIYVFLWTMTRLGRTLARLLLLPVIAYYFVTSRRVRRSSRAFLRRVGQPGGATAVFRHLLRFGQVALDRLLFVQGRATAMEYDLGPVELLHELRDRQGGALLLGAHVGSFEALGGMAREHQLAVTPVVNTNNSRMLMGVLEKVNPELAARVVDIGAGRLDAIFEIRKRLERGEHIGLLADRVSGDERSVTVEFMGQQARFPAGPFILAATLQCPVYFVAAIYGGGNRYRIHAERFADCVTLPRKDRNAGLVRWASLYATKLETLARAEPMNWFNLFDFWDLGDRRGPRYTAGTKGVSNAV